MEAHQEEQLLSPRDLLLQDIFARLDSTGDLPIFSSSVSRIQTVGSDPEVNAMDLAMEVLKDANLTTKILKLANSTYYNRGVSKVGALSRAVVVLGFDLIKSTVVAMKLIDSFQQEHAAVELEGLLVRAYMSAGLVRELAELSGQKKPEESFICGMLHGLGEIVVASVMPEKYRKMVNYVAQEKLSWAAAQKKVLHQPLYAIGQAVAEKWEFAETTTESMQPFQGATNKPIRNAAKFNRAAASLTSELMELLYEENPHGNRNFAEISAALATVTGTGTDTIAASLEKAFSQSSVLAESYGLDKSCLLPQLSSGRNTGDELRDEFAQMLYAQIEGESLIEDEFSPYFAEDEEYDGYDDEASEVSEHREHPQQQGDTAALLSIIQQITLLIAQKAPLNTVFNKVLEGITDGLGFDRSMLCLLSPERTHYSARIVYGEVAQDLREIFRLRAVDTQNDLFSKIIMQGNELLVEDAHVPELRPLLPDSLLRQLHVDQFLIGAMHVNNKPVGLFYADKVRTHSTTSSEQYRGFLQLVGQAQLALQVR